MTPATVRRGAFWFLAAVDAAALAMLGKALLHTVIA